MTSDLNETAFEKSVVRIADFEAAGSFMAVDNVQTAENRNLILVGWMAKSKLDSAGLLHKLTTVNL